MKIPLIEIKNLNVRIGEKQILNDFSLVIPAGETHVIMGPNGCGKSTLSNVIAGHPAYTITSGDILFKGQSILDKTVDERANMGIFLGFQYPTEIPGVTYKNFLRQSIDALFKASGIEPLNPLAFKKRLSLRMNAFDLKEEVLNRFVNVGFSGGEKKKMDMLQLAFLEPSFAILDELDSGLDIDALKTITRATKVLAEPNRSFLLITHYQRLLDYLTPDKIHIMMDGHIVKTGGKELAKELEETGYRYYEK